jgi:hypothetical protein
MDQSEPKEKGFKVEDRRRFSPEGELKPEHREADPHQQDRKEPQAPEGKPVAGDAAAGKTDASAQAAAAPRSASASGASAPPRDAPAAEATEITFATFIVGLSTQALLHLGEIPDPATGEHLRDLAGAQQLIDILGMLQAKTRGNLAADEQHLIEAILFDLRMKYVEIARQAPR